MHWIERSADRNGDLPEQVSEDVQSPHMLGYWRDRWGSPTSPLLWSHAIYIVPQQDIDEATAAG